ncbi:aminopeptidase N-like [Lissotriton helveticus]
MAKGIYISRTLLVVGILFSVASVATVIALSVLYSEEKANSNSSPPSSSPTVSTTTAASSTPTPQPSNPWNRYRLPNTVIPHHYDLELQPHLEKDSRGLYIFKGKSTAYFTAAAATNLILIHSNKLNYTHQGEFHVSLRTDDGSDPPPIQRTGLEIPTQYLVVELNRNLEQGKSYSMYTEFTGELADDLAGFYRSEYVEDNETRIIATTMMSPSDARKAFPCFDEPAMKATFNITLIHKPQYEALSNMPKISTVPKVIDSVTWHVTTFGKTPKVSTYLLAFIVCDFDKIEKMNNNVQIRIWARKKAIQENQGEYALNVTGPILTLVQEYYRAPYPLPKSEQVAIPDFSAGAMENWGLIAYRETALLFDPLESSIANKERVVTVIAHELAHQWFGNLVTPKWWNDVWLKEGFASYVEYLGVDHVEPSWNFKDLILFNDVYTAMGFDALATSHPLSSKAAEINTPAEVRQLFDAISYSKGASIMRMLSEILSEELFKEGLRVYLLINEYNNTVADDLWSSLQKAVDNQTSVQLPHSVRTIMDTWVLQMGFPVITINTSTGEITQQHFLLDPESNVTRPSEFNYTWIVPITWMKTGSAQSTFWLNGKSAVNNAFKLSTGSSDWVLANLNVTVYFRVNYDQGNWDRLLQQLASDHTAIPVMNRAQIIDDAFNLARAKHIETTSALDTTRYLSKEREYMPWEAALRSLSYFSLMFDRSSVYRPMRQYLRKQVGPLFLHFKNETNDWKLLPDGLTDQYNEINAVNTACYYGIPECQALATDLYRKWMNNPNNNSITPNLRSAIYCHAIAIGGEEEWFFALEMLKRTTVAAEADKLRAALACSREPWILNRYLEYTWDRTIIRKQDGISTISSIANNAAGQSIAWDFIRANWEKIFLEYSGSSFSFKGLIDNVARRFSSQFELTQLETFKKDNEHVGFGSAARELEQALEKTKANIRWVLENREPVRLWFEAQIRHSF